ncbi:MAG: hypothetical protein KatS3mg110_1990 [Pirellulaceae bacterium]|nr:MAG: hypothetical protein KatS3mg110_1990 [Pirellulaceae bacterium]
MGGIVYGLDHLEAGTVFVGRTDVPYVKGRYV